MCIRDRREHNVITSIYIEADVLEAHNNKLQEKYRRIEQNETMVEEYNCCLLYTSNLPGENGYELCRKLRQHSDAPVIFLTAREAPEDELLGFSVGADDYIRKPYHSCLLYTSRCV